jgi:hypothetical protein
LLLAYRTLFGGDIGLNGFKLVAVIRVGGCGAQQYASAERAGVKQRLTDNCGFTTHVIEKIAFPSWGAIIPR